MLTFLIVLVYFAAFTPLYILAYKAIKEREIKKGEVKRDILLTVGIVACLSIGLYCLRIYAESLWFSELGYGSRFWTEVGTKWGIFALIGTIVFVVCWLNLLGLKKGIKPDSGDRD